MALKPEVSLGLAAATGTVVWAIYDHSMPKPVDTRASAAGNPSVDSQRRIASWTAAAAVAGISLLAKDPTIFIVGGAMVIALDWTHRHANVVDNVTNKVTAPNAQPQVTGNPGASVLNN
jgi:hypothetical protein